MHLLKTQYIDGKAIHLWEAQYIYGKHNAFMENTIHLSKTQ